MANVPLREKESHLWGELLIPMCGAWGRGCPREPPNTVKQVELVLSTLRMRCQRLEMLGDLPGVPSLLEKEQSQVLMPRLKAFPWRVPPALQALQQGCGLGPLSAFAPGSPCHSSRRLCTTCAASRAHP